MEKALVTNAEFQCGVNGMIVEVHDAQDLEIIATGNTTFKLQGSLSGGAYTDIAGSSQTSDGAATTCNVAGVFQSQAFDHIKVVIDAGVCLAIKRWMRTAPRGGATPFTKAARRVLLVDPQAGTA